MPLHLIYILLLPAGSKMVCSEFQAIFYEWYKIFGIKKKFKNLFWEHLVLTYRFMRGIF